MRTLNLETPTHGRVLIAEATGTSVATVIAFHGYAQNADAMMAELRQIPGSDRWTLVAVQALNRFYTRGDQTVVANWMTRQDRDQAISDNIGYVNRVIEHLEPGPICALGFSQGVAMAYRAALLGHHRIDGIVAVGGDIPPDVKAVPPSHWPRVLVAAGHTDHWFTPDKVAADDAFLRNHGVRFELLRYDAGHVFTDEVRNAIAAFLTPLGRAESDMLNR